jgi:single-strand DNA-binding protein
MGNLTRDPELKYTSSNNTAVCTYTLAVKRRFKKDETDFINCTVWSKEAEFASKYFTKGTKISIVGRLNTRSWEDENGKRRYATDVVVEEQYFAGSKADNQSSKPKEEPQQSESKEAVLDDDLPF